MADHLFFLDEDVKVTVDTVIVLPVVEIHAVFPTTLLPIVVPETREEQV